MPENNAPSLDRDMAELIRLQKKQLLHQRIRTVLSAVACAALMAAVIAFIQLLPEIQELLRSAGELIEKAETLLDEFESADASGSFFEGFDWLEGLFR